MIKGSFSFTLFLFLLVFPMRSSGQGLDLCVREHRLTVENYCRHYVTRERLSSSLRFSNLTGPSRQQLRMYGIIAGVAGTGLSAILLPEISPIIGTLALAETVHLAAGGQGNLLGEILVASAILAAGIGGGLAIGIATGNAAPIYAAWGAGIVFQSFAVTGMELKAARRTR